MNDFFGLFECFGYLKMDVFIFLFFILLYNIINYDDLLKIRAVNIYSN
jgi:hypothetical protein